jgi:hypothetical protein
MLVQALLVSHIAVLGYWLGAELVINSTYRYVAWSAAMPFAERDRLMQHVMDVDQHVRYALILQAGLGAALAALLGYVPGGGRLALTAAALAAAWLVLVEAVHRARSTPAGKGLAALDRAVRYLAMAVLLGVAGAAAVGESDLPGWLAWKLVLFAGVIACGLGIRVALIAFFRVWHEVALEGSSTAREQRIRRACVRATTVLVALWLLIGTIVGLSVLKPG